MPTNEQAAQPMDVTVDEIVNPFLSKLSSDDPTFAKERQFAYGLRQRYGRSLTREELAAEIYNTASDAWKQRYRLVLPKSEEVSGGTKPKGEGGASQSTTKPVSSTVGASTMTTEPPPKSSDPWVGIRRGAIKGVEALAHFGANTAMALKRPFEAGVVGGSSGPWMLPAVAGATFFGGLEKGLRGIEQAEQKKASQLPQPEGVVAGLAHSVPQMIGELAPYAIPGAATPIGMAAVEGMRSADKGPIEAATSGATAFGLGKWGFPLMEKVGGKLVTPAAKKILERVPGVSAEKAAEMAVKVARPVSVGGTMSAISGAGGATPEEAISQGLLWGGVSALGGSRAARKAETAKAAGGAETKSGGKAGVKTTPPGEFTKETVAAMGKADAERLAEELSGKLKPLHEELDLRRRQLSTYEQLQETITRELRESELINGDKHAETVAIKKSHGENASRIERLKGDIRRLEGNIGQLKRGYDMIRETYGYPEGEKPISGLIGEYPKPPAPPLEAEYEMVGPRPVSGRSPRGLLEAPPPPRPTTEGKPIEMPARVIPLPGASSPKGLPAGTGTAPPLDKFQELENTYGVSAGELQHLASQPIEVVRDAAQRANAVASAFVDGLKAPESQPPRKIGEGLDEYIERVRAQAMRLVNRAQAYQAVLTRMSEPSAPPPVRQKRAATSKGAGAAKAPAAAPVTPPAKAPAAAVATAEPQTVPAAAPTVVAGTTGSAPETVAGEGPTSKKLGVAPRKRNRKQSAAVATAAEPTSAQTGAAPEAPSPLPPVTEPTPAPTPTPQPTTAGARSTTRRGRPRKPAAVSVAPIQTPSAEVAAVLPPESTGPSPNEPVWGVARVIGNPRSKPRLIPYDATSTGMTKAEAEEALRDIELYATNRGPVAVVPLSEMETTEASRSSAPTLSPGETYLRSLGGLINARKNRPTRSVGRGEGELSTEVETIITATDKRGNPTAQYKVRFDEETNQWRAVQLSAKGNPLPGTERSGDDRASLEALIGRKPRTAPPEQRPSTSAAISATAHGATPAAPPPLRSAARAKSEVNVGPPVSTLEKGKTYIVRKADPDMLATTGERLVYLGDANGKAQFRSEGGAIVFADKPGNAMAESLSDDKPSVVRRFLSDESGEISYDRLVQLAKELPRRAKGKIIKTAWISPYGGVHSFTWSDNLMHPDVALKILRISTKGVPPEEVNKLRDKAEEKLLGYKWIRLHDRHVEASPAGAETEGFQEAVDAAVEAAKYRGLDSIYVQVGPEFLPIPLKDVGNFLSDPTGYFNRGTLRSFLRSESGEVDYDALFRRGQKAKKAEGVEGKGESGSGEAPPKPRPRFPAGYFVKPGGEIIHLDEIASHQNVAGMRNAIDNGGVRGRGANVEYKRLDKEAMKSALQEAVRYGDDVYVDSPAGSSVYDSSDIIAAGYDITKARPKQRWLK